MLVAALVVRVSSSWSAAVVVEVVALDALLERDVVCVCETTSVDVVVCESSLPADELRLLVDSGRSEVEVVVGRPMMGMLTSSIVVELRPRGT